jgi:uncharacterized RDD family membrane protein YckC
LAVVNAGGEPASPAQLLLRWAIVWLPLLLPTTFLVVLMRQTGGNGVALVAAGVVLLLWTGAAIVTVVNAHRGWHDRLAGTWVVRR